MLGIVRIVNIILNGNNQDRDKMKELIVKGFERGHGITFTAMIGDEPTFGFFFFWNKKHSRKG